VNQAAIRQDIEFRSEANIEFEISCRSSNKEVDVQNSNHRNRFPSTKESGHQFRLIIKLRRLKRTAHLLYCKLDEEDSSYTSVGILMTTDG